MLHKKCSSLIAKDNGMNRIDDENIVEAKSLSYQVRDKMILHEISFKIAKGETFVITGPSGSGKTTLAKILAGNINPSGGEIVFANDFDTLMVSQQDRFVSASGIRVSYYSQRYENPNEEGIPDVSEYLHRAVPGIQPDWFLEVLSELEIEPLRDRKILSLSNGERKRVQLAEALLQNPGMLVLDQPFIGLDTHSREKLSEILHRLKKSDITLVIVSDEFHIPHFTDNVIFLGSNANNRIVPYHDFHQSEKEDLNLKVDEDPELIHEITRSESHSSLVVRMLDVNVLFRGNKVLRNINWEIRAGEKWLLYGPNGAGKTTLLSLISTDNPQGYSNDIVLFDRQRGSGESIWDIKKKIGFVSPELHHYFLRRKSIYKPALGETASYSGLSCLDVVLSGLKDEVGFSSLRTEMETKLARSWLRLIGMEHLEKASFLQSSLGEQRILLLARALIKLPELLVLDEPCQGLDHWQTRQFLSLLDLICTGNQTTLIYVTHRAEEIPSCITNELALENGSVVKNNSFNRN